MTHAEGVDPGQCATGDGVCDLCGLPQLARLFPTIRGMRLIRRGGAKVVLKIDHAEGKAVNELVLCPPEEIASGSPAS